MEPGPDFGSDSLSGFCRSIVPEFSFFRAFSVRCIKSRSCVPATKGKGGRGREGEDERERDGGGGREGGREGRKEREREREGGKERHGRREGGWYGGQEN